MSSDFSTDREIGKTRKDHRCEACGKMIPAGSKASYFAGRYDGEFYSCHYHSDCREAEITLNRFQGNGAEDWLSLYNWGEFDADEIAFLLEKYPEVADRIGLKVEPFE